MILFLFLVSALVLYFLAKGDKKLCHSETQALGLTSARLDSETIHQWILKLGCYYSWSVC